MPLFQPPQTLSEYSIHGWHDPIRRSNWNDVFTAVAYARYNQAPTGSTAGYLEWDLWLPAGTYRCLVDTIRFSNVGIAEVFVDGNSFGTFDGYNAALQLWAFRLATTYVLTEGTHTIRLAKTGTKNITATDYLVAVHQLTLVRT